jgi:hypothetical protein
LLPEREFSYPSGRNERRDTLTLVTPVKVYVASSWRNSHQPGVVAALRGNGHEVYDFRNPKAGDHGFDWSQIDPGWQTWSLTQYVEALQSRRAEDGFQHDQTALEWCECCVLVLPSGGSAHLEAGWCAGRGKSVIVYAPQLAHPELMYKLFNNGRPRVVDTIELLLSALAREVSRDGTGLR